MTAYAPLTLFLAAAATAGEPVDLMPPKRVRVLGVFFRPTDQPVPRLVIQQRLMDHLRLTQKRYLQMLGGRDTFELADDKAHVYDAKHALAFYRKQPQGGAPQYAGELLDHYRVSRFACPYAFVIVIVNPNGGFPNGGGRPINGGFNLGGGIVIMSSRGLEVHRNFQSTLEHELGHSFGLLHVNAYGYSMRENDSIMSYNRSHHSQGLQLSKTPGLLIPEDIRALAMNDRVFPKLAFDPTRDAPKAYKLKPVRWLGPMHVAGHPSGIVKATTTSASELRSRPRAAVQNQIRPNRMDVKFDRRTMWVAKAGKSGWVEMEVEFPFAVTIDRIHVHSQICGITHEATAVRVEVKAGDAFTEVAEQDLPSPDASASFEAVTGQAWRLRFKAAKSGKVLLRGLRFFHGGQEIFPPMVPYSPDGV